MKVEYGAICQDAQRMLDGQVGWHPISYRPPVVMRIDDRSSNLDVETTRIRRKMRYR